MARAALLVFGGIGAAVLCVAAAGTAVEPVALAASGVFLVTMGWIRSSRVRRATPTPAAGDSMGMEARATR